MFLLDDIARWLKGRKKDLRVVGSPGGFPVLEVFPLPLLVCDKGLSILRANPAFTRHFKVDGGHLKGKTALQILGTEFKMIEERGGWFIKERQVSNHGDFVHLVEKPNPKILQGNFPKIGQRVFHLHTQKALPVILLVFEDVTKSRERDDKIQKSRHELLSTFDGIEDPLVMIDKNCRIRRFNEAMLNAVGGNSYKGFIGGACWYKLHGLKERCPGCTADRTFATGKKTTRLGLLQARTDADNFAYQISCYPLKDAAGKVTGIAEGYRDVTEIQRIEKELYESERNRIMEPLAAGIAHEIRNPLAIIKSTAQYCLGEIRENKDLQESLQTVIKSAESANRVISDFLNFARPQQIEFQTRPLKPALEQALRLIKVRARNQKVRITKTISKSIPPFLLDEKRFQQALVNLLMNSLDSMPHGGKIHLEAKVEPRDKVCLVILRDTGTGVPEEMVSKVFQPFYSTKKGGVGLGLPIAEAIVRSHGGRISLKSWEGKGSEVTLTLPLRKLRYGKKLSR